MAQRGRNVLLKISDGTSPGNFTTLGGMRTKNIVVNNEMVDVTTADEAPWRLLLGDAGMRSISISGSGLFKDDITINRIEDASFNGSIQEFQIVFENGDKIQGLFQVTSFSYNAEQNAAQMFELTLESANTCVFTRQSGA